MKSYHCDHCGRRLKPDQWIYSRWTGSRYCTDLNACTKRAKRSKTKQVA
jgi:hypothetical protein